MAILIEDHLPVVKYNGLNTEKKIVMSKTNPDAAHILINGSISQANAYSGTLAVSAADITCSATGAIGNVMVGYFALTQSALPSSQGTTCAIYAEVSAGGTGNNPTSIVSLVRSGATTGTSMPFIRFDDAGSNKTTTLFEIGTSNAVGTNTDGTALYETSASIGNVDEITAGLRVKVNGVDYYLLMATPTNIQD